MKSKNIQHVERKGAAKQKGHLKEIMLLHLSAHHFVQLKVQKCVKYLLGKRKSSKSHFY